MLAQTREKDLKTFEDLSRGAFEIKDRATVDLRVLIPAFMISELRRGFEMGFLIALPFLVIDMIVATLTMSMGMMMLPPSADFAADEAAVLRADRRLEHADRQPRQILYVERPQIVMV